IAFNRSLGCQPRTHLEYLACVSAGGVNLPILAAAEACDLRGGGADQNGVQVIRVQTVDGPLVPRAQQDLALRVESQRVDDILPVVPHALRLSVRMDSVNLRAATHARRRRHGSWRRRGNALHHYGRSAT